MNEARRNIHFLLCALESEAENKLYVEFKHPDDLMKIDRASQKYFAAHEALVSAIDAALADTEK